MKEMQKVLVAKGIIDEQGRVLMDNIRQQLDLVDQINKDNLSQLDAVSEKEESGSLLDALLAEEEDDLENEKVAEKSGKCEEYHSH